MDTEVNGRPVFHPTFGSRPAQIIGRDTIIEEFLQSLDDPVGSRDRCTFFVGQRGMGKTAILQELAEKAGQKNFVTASVTCYEQMNDEIIEILQQKGNELFGRQKRKLAGVEAGALGFSFGFTFSEAAREQYGFRSKLTMLVDRFREYGKGVLILVDEAKSSQSMRQLAVTYQQLVGENKNISICMAGLPASISAVLNDDVLTFLNRAKKVQIGPISTLPIRDYYEIAFENAGIKLSEDTVEDAAKATKGFPYLMQLIGFYMMKYADRISNEDDLLSKARETSQRDLEENVYEPILKPLSDLDIEFLHAMAKDSGTSKISEICERLKKGNSAVQPYRQRLIEGGIIESPRRGEVEFTIPYIGEYLRNKYEN